ncbi:MAG: hypothetical protein ABII01_01925 [Candidatus Woesearchaeota archaeon]
MKFNKKKVAIELEEILIIILIILSFLEFFGLLFGELDFIKKIISWTVLGFLLYQASITKIFFGDKHKLMDLSLIIAFFLLLAKDLVSISGIIIEKGGIDFFTPIHIIIYNNLWVIETTGFVIGSLVIIFSSIFLTFNLHVKKPSIIHVLHDAGIPKSFWKKVERFLIVFLVLNAFFTLVFNLVMEWLAIAIDSSLMVFTVIIFLILFLKKHGRKFSIHSAIFKIAETSESFYQNFINLFHSKKRIYLGFSGLLVLHLITDIGVFILPYLFSFQDLFYFGNSQLTSISSSVSIFSLYTEQILNLSVLEIISLTYLYFFNIVAIIVLLISPAYIWRRIYKKEGFKIGQIDLALFYTSILTFLIAPLFAIDKISSPGYIGVSLTTIPINVIFDFYIIMLFSILFGLVIFYLGYNHKLKNILIILGLIIIALFFSYYIFNYFLSSINYYISSIMILWKWNKFFIASIFGLFFVITSAAYVFGWIVFLLEIKKEYKYIK